MAESQLQNQNFWTVRPRNLYFEKKNASRILLHLQGRYLQRLQLNGRGQREGKVVKRDKCVQLILPSGKPQDQRNPSCHTFPSSRIGSFTFKFPLRAQAWEPSLPQPGAGEPQKTSQSGEV